MPIPVDIEDDKKIIQQARFICDLFKRKSAQEQPLTQMTDIINTLRRCKQDGINQMHQAVAMMERNYMRNDRVIKNILSDNFSLRAKNRELREAYVKLYEKVNKS